MNMYQVVESEPGLWTTGFRHPVTREWEPDSDHSTNAEARDRARWLNGNLRRGLVYRRTEENLWTVGSFNGNGTWLPDEDFGSRQAAARSVAHRNGTDLISRPQWQGPVAMIVEEI
jgi:hypothetical protein